MSEDGKKPYDPATWQPEDGDPFKGDRYDRANGAFRDAADQFGRPKRRRPSAGGFLLSWLWHYFFPSPRR